MNLVTTSRIAPSTASDVPWFWDSMRFPAAIAALGAAKNGALIALGTEMLQSASMRIEQATHQPVHLYR